MKREYLARKVHYVIGIISLTLMLIFSRVWYLSVLQHDKYLQEAQKPQTRTILLHANRGEIFDRYGKPLAINRICYNASIYYAHIKQIPTMQWQKDAAGNKLRTYPRKEYINSLSKLLAKELDLEQDRIEDLIHCKASLLPHVPFVIKKNITEQQYFRLKMFEREYTGLHAEITTERFYPYGKCGCNILGYMGKISQQEYLSIARKIEHLQQIADHEEEEYYLIEGYNSKEEVLEKLHLLKEKAYTYNDLIGKVGLEKTFETQLRGRHGKDQFIVNNKGIFLQKLTSSYLPRAGQSLQSTISIDLQQFAEALLAQDEKEREGKSRKWDTNSKTVIQQKQPWIKGGAILALDPNSGEILALASYPRFDPNDFIFSADTQKVKQLHIHQWLETPSQIANIWDNTVPLEKECFSKKSDYYLQKQWLSWEQYIKMILPKECPVGEALLKIQTVKSAILLQEDFAYLLFAAKSEDDPQILMDCLFPKSPHISCQPFSPSHQNVLDNLLQAEDVSAAKKRLIHYLSPIQENKDKLLVIDLCRMAIYSPAFSDELMEKVGTLKLSQYWKISKAAIKLEQYTKEKLFPLFHKIYFSKWKQNNQKQFLAQKRKEEKEKQIYARPYIEYLDQKEKQLFYTFWQENKYKFMLAYLKNNLSKELSFDLRPYFAEISNFIASKDIPNDIAFSIVLLKQELEHMETLSLIDLLRTFRSFSMLDRPLHGFYNHLRKHGNTQLEKDLAAAFYPMYGYSFGRSYAYSQAAPIGSIFKLVTAYTWLKEKYAQGYQNLPSFTMIDHYGWDIKAAKQGGHIVGYQMDGRPYPRFYKGGRLPKSSHLGIGKIDLRSAIEQSSNPYFSILAKDYLSNPKNLLWAAKQFGIGKAPSIELNSVFRGTLPDDIEYNTTGLYSFAIGQHTLTATPLHAAQILATIANKGILHSPTIVKNSSKDRQEIFLPDTIRKILIESMHNVIYGKKGNARPSIIKKLYQHPELMEEYKSLENAFIGKTSTAEIMDKCDVLPSSKAEKYKHIWFGSVSFSPSPKKWEKPELVVIVYLRYGDGGKEAAPLAAQIIKKYREIKKEHQKEEKEISSFVNI